MNQTTPSVAAQPSEPALASTLAKATPAKLRVWLSWLAAFGVAITGATLYAYVVQFGKYGFSPDHTRWSEFGGYIGGTLGPVAAFLGFAAVALTVVAQVKQLEDAAEKSMSDRAESERLAKAQRETLEAMRAQVDQMTRQALVTEDQLKQSKIESERYAEIQAEMVVSMREQAAQLAATARVAALTSALADVRIEIDGYRSTSMNQSQAEALRAAQSRQHRLRSDLVKTVDGLSSVGRPN